MTETGQDELPGPDWSVVGAMVEVCEHHASRLFDGDVETESYTGITTWRDGDFRIHVHHGKSHEKAPYCQRVEEVTYRHEDGNVVYADYTRFIDTREREIHEQQYLDTEIDQ